MCKEVEVVLGLLNSALFNKEFNKINTDEFDMAKLFKFAQIHSISAIIFEEMQKYYNSDEMQSIYNDEMAKYFSVIQRAASQELEYETVTKLLYENHISFLPVKGWIIKNLYPIKEFRTMGDIDLLIHDCDKEKCDSIMKQLGYTCLSFSHGSYEKGKMEIELHRSLNEGYSKIDLLDNIWDYATTEDGILYNLDNFVHLIFLIYHAKKHIEGSGCGIRMMLDIAIFTYKYSSEIDYNKLKEVLKNNKILKTAQVFYSLIEKWFGIENHLGNIDDKVLYQFEQFVIANGTFGFDNKENQSNAVLMVYNKEYKGKSRFIRTLRCVFPSYKVMTDKYHILIKCPILLPFCWIWRIIKYIIHPRGRGATMIKGAKEMDQKKEFFESIGMMEK